MFDGGKQLSVSYKDSGSLCKRSTGWIPDPAENYHQFINFDVPPPSPPSCCDQPKTGNIFIMISIVSFISFNTLKREA